MDDCCCCCCIYCINYFENEAKSAETDEKNDRKPIKYQQLEFLDDTDSDTNTTTINVVLPRYEKIPVEKIFQFQQPVFPVYMHPQFSIADSTTVTQQPTTTTTFRTTTGPSAVESGSHSKLHDEPSIQFSLYYDFQRKVLCVYLHAAFCLLGGRVKSKHEADSLVMLFLVPHKQHMFYSAVVKKTNNPSFNEAFEFTDLLSSEVRRQSLIFRVFDKSRSEAQSELGTVILPLETANLYGMSTTKPIMSMAEQDEAGILDELKSSNGDVLVSLMHDPSVNIISGVLLKARNLQKMYIGGLSDPYVKIYFLHKGTRITKWKSNIMKKTVSPIYNEPFQFDTDGMDIDFVELQLTMFDHDTLGSDDVMGTVEFGMKSKHHTGRLHWIEMASSPRNHVCFWHSMDKPH